MRIPFGLLLAFSPFVLTSPASAQSLDEQATAVHFWNYAECVVKRDKWLVEKVLQAPKNSDMRRDLTRKLAKKNNSCLPKGYNLRLSGQMMRNAVAGAYVAHSFTDYQAMDFSQTSEMYPAAKLAEFDRDKHRLSYGMKMFAECVARREFSQVVALLSTKPSSAAEAEAFDRLQSTMGDCLPVSQGTKLKFTRLDLRGRLGMVAYELAAGANVDADSESPDA